LCASQRNQPVQIRPLLEIQLLIISGTAKTKSRTQIGRADKIEMKNAIWFRAALEISQDGHAKRSLVS
jgi:hypothetical protein